MTLVGVLSKDGEKPDRPGNAVAGLFVLFSVVVDFNAENDGRTDKRNGVCDG